MAGNREFKAVVFGAGIAGLTVAHELAERRFKVWVVEPTQDTNRYGVEDMAIGGMARTQYAALGANPQLAAQKQSLPLTPITVFTLSDVHGERMNRYLAYLREGEQIRIIGRQSDLMDELKAQLRSKTNLDPEGTPFEYTPVPEDEGHIVVVRRTRRTRLPIVERTPRRPELSRLSSLGSYRLKEFTEGLRPGDKVRVWAPGWLSSAVHGRELRADLPPPGLRPRGIPRPREFPSLIVPATREIFRKLADSHAEVSEELEVSGPSDDIIELVRAEFPKRLKLHHGRLTPESQGELDAFLAGVRSGDIIELHASDELREAAGVDEILDALKLVEAVGVLTWSQAVVMPSMFDRDVIPGEHGFRFFPAYYRHLRNTLERIPVFERRWGPDATLDFEISGRTVIDNLVNTPVQAAVGNSSNPLLSARTPSGSPTAMFLQFRDLLLQRGYDARDVHQFVLRLLRYMCTGSRRREAEGEGLSWWEYLRGYDPSTGIYRYRYSAAFEKDIGDSPRVLAAFDAEWGDARTNGNTFVQLLLSQFVDNDAVDQVLNAPTTEAWFEHWAMYLQRYLDVTFVAAKVEALVGDNTDGSVKPRLSSVLTGPNPELKELEQFIGAGEINYFVVATDAPTAEKLTRIVDEKGTLLPAFQIGVAAELGGYATIVRASPRGGVGASPRVSLKYGDRPWDRFQTLTGIQYFFTNVTGIFDGHVYFMDAPSALSSINQHQFWRLSPIVRGAAYQSLLSADIGRFDDEWIVASASRTADKMWLQIVDALREYWDLHMNDARLEYLRRVGFDWYHLDRNILLDQQENRSPYLIPIVCDWQNRPADTLWDPGEVVSLPPSAKPTADLWHAPWGGYRVHWGQWLFAGTYLRHFTRMTTMEAANESGRHAVNAILDNLIERSINRPTVAAVAGHLEKRRYPGAGNPLDPHSAYVPTPFGDYCHIWDPEKYELVDFVPMREFDDWCFEHGLPHPWDLTGQEIVPSLISYLPSAHELGLPSVNDILRALTPPFTPPPGMGLP